MTYCEALSLSDAAVIYPDHFSVHTAFFTRTPALSVLEEGKTIRGLKEGLEVKTYPCFTLIHLPMKESFNRP